MKELKKIKYSVAVFFLAISAISCDDFLDPEIEDGLTREDNYQTYLNAQGAVLGLYGKMQQVLPDQVILGELRGDLVEVTGNANADLQDIYNYQYQDNRYVNAEQYYDIILNCNDALQGFLDLRERDVAFERDYDFFVAEVTTVKVWTYFSLLKNFQNPVLNENNLETFQPSRGEPITAGTLISMMSEAVEALNASVPGWSGAQDRFNYGSAQALLGELYLYNNEYNNAITSLTTAILSGSSERFILSDALEEDNWINIFAGENSDEVMSQLIYSKGNQQTHELQRLFSDVGSNTYELRPTAISLNLFDDNYRGEGASYILSGTNAIVSKFTLGKNEFDDDAPIIQYRAADLHLMLAEAYNRIEEFQIASDLINNGSDSLFSQLSRGIRGRVGANSIRWVANLSTAQDSMLFLENQVINERARELAYEGKRWYDLVRISRHRSDPAYLADKVKMKYPVADTMRVKQLLLDENNWFLPLN